MASDHIDNESVHDYLQNVLAASREGLVDNCFRKWNEQEVNRVVEAFVVEYDLIHKKDVFLKAGQILRLPEEWRGYEDILAQDEIDALNKEKAGFLGQRKEFIIAILTLCVAATVQGWTQTISNGANLSWPAATGLDSFNDCQPTDSDVWKFAIVNAVPWFAASFIGTWISDPLSEYLLGRRAPILISAVIIFASALGSACSETWWELLVCRIILGIGMGCKATVVPVMAAEISPPHVRGSLVMNWQVFDAFGILLGFSANLIAAQFDHSWRWQMASLCIPTFALMILIYIIPDSPRYLMRRKAQRRAQQIHRIGLAVRRYVFNVLRACFYLLQACCCMGVPGNATTSNTAADNAAIGTATTNNTATLTTTTSDTTADDATAGDATLGDATAGDTADGNATVGDGAVGSDTRATTNTATKKPSQSYRRAFEALKGLRLHEIIAAKELLHIHFQMVVEMEVILHGDSADATSDATAATDEPSEQHQSLNVWLQSPTTQSLKYSTKVGHLISKPRVRRALVAAVVCMISQQLCGVNVLAFYSSTLFKSTLTSCPGSRTAPNTNPSNASNTPPLLLSWGIGLANVTFAIPSYWLIEKIKHPLLGGSGRGSGGGKGGRRWLLLVTSPLMTLSMLAATLSYLIPRHDSGYTPTIAFFTYVFMAFYSLGMGPVPFTLSSEVFPMEHRLVGMSVAVFFNFFGAGLLTLFVPVIASSSFSNIGLLGIFTFLNIVAFALIFLFVPETAAYAVGEEEGSMVALSLEDLTAIFNIPTFGKHGFIHYQRTEVLTWIRQYARWKIVPVFQLVGLWKQVKAPEQLRSLRQWIRDNEAAAQRERNAAEPSDKDEHVNGNI